MIDVEQLHSPGAVDYLPLSCISLVGRLLSSMSIYHLNLVAINPKREDLRTDPIRVIVDTGAELSWLPVEVLTAIGITPPRKRLFAMADNRTMVRDVGYCILEAEGYATNDEVVFAQPGDMHLLGVRTLEGFGVMVDPQLLPDSRSRGRGFRGSGDCPRLLPGSLTFPSRGVTLGGKTYFLAKRL